MRLGIDAREIQEGVHTGIGRPLANFLNYFSRQNNDDECVLFSSKKIPLNFGKRIRNIVIKEGWTFYWDQIKLAQAIKKEDIDIFYSPYYKVPLLANCKVVSSILDLMYLKYEVYRRNLNPISRLYYRFFGKLFTQKALKIITCSEYSKKDIIETYNISEEKISVIPLSLGMIYRKIDDKDQIEQVKKNFRINSNYILYLGNFKPHKNVKNIILASKKVINEFPDIRIVLAGPKKHEYSELCRLIENNKLKDNVIFTGIIHEEDNPGALYGGAEVFVMPSFFEGFGLPLLEAMACGTPVVASNCTSIPEVVRDSGILVDPHNVNEIAQAILNILNNDQLRRDLVQKGIKISQDYSEENVADQTYTLLKSL